MKLEQDPTGVRREEGEGDFTVDAKWGKDASRDEDMPATHRYRFKTEGERQASLLGTKECFGWCDWLLEYERDGEQHFESGE